jgi:hypothetical protein
LKLNRAVAAAWIISLVAPPSWAGQQPPGEFHSAAQTVTLVAQLPDAASVAGLISPVPQDLLADGQTAEIVTLRESWTFAQGETLDAQCEVVTEPEAAAELFTSKAQYLATSLISTASSFGARQVRTFPLVAGFDPAKGLLTNEQSLLIVHNVAGDTSSAAVRITITAVAL